MHLDQEIYILILLSFDHLSVVWYKPLDEVMNANFHFGTQAKQG